jgi:uridine phosphorylase
MNRIAESELIINERGAVYHLDCRPEEVATTIITVGDPGRVKEVSVFFDNIEFQNQNREFITHTGFIGDKRITCVSTGIGTSNIDIVLQELDALANIDLNTRTIQKDFTPLKIIRIGTAGSLQKEIPVDSFVISTHGIGLDNLLHFYEYRNNDEEFQLLKSFENHMQFGFHHISPYLFSASAKLLNLFGGQAQSGMTVTCPGFFGPQGRVLRIRDSYHEIMNHLSSFQFGNFRIANFEMETSAIYGLSKCMGHYAVSLSAIVANRVTNEFSKNSSRTINKLIEQTLRQIADSNL